MSDQSINIVTCILAVGAAAAPFILAVLVVQMTKYFTPRSEFASLKEQLAREHKENREDLREMKDNVKVLEGDIKTVLKMKIEEHRAH